MSIGAMRPLKGENDLVVGRMRVLLGTPEFDMCDGSKMRKEVDEFSMRSARDAAHRHMGECRGARLADEVAEERDIVLSSVQKARRIFFFKLFVQVTVFANPRSTKNCSVVGAEVS